MDADECEEEMKKAMQSANTFTSNLIIFRYVIFLSEVKLLIAKTTCHASGDAQK